MYYIVLGFVVTFVIALIVNAIYPESICDNPDLFAPFVTKRFRKSELLLNNTNKTVSIFILFAFFY